MRWRGSDGLRNRPEMCYKQIEWGLDAELHDGAHGLSLKFAGGCPCRCPDAVWEIAVAVTMALTQLNRDGQLEGPTGSCCSRREGARRRGIFQLRKEEATMLLRRDEYPAISIFR